jgi:hypothetical protein
VRRKAAKHRDEKSPSVLNSGVGDVCQFRRHTSFDVFTTDTFFEEFGFALKGYQRHPRERVGGSIHALLFEGNQKVVGAELNVLAHTVLSVFMPRSLTGMASRTKPCSISTAASLIISQMRSGVDG